MKEALIELNQALDEEIKLYKEIETTIYKKKGYLVKRDIENLNKADDNIIHCNQTLSDKVQKRIAINTKFGDPNIELKSIIKKAPTIDKDLANSIKEKRNSINKIIKSIKRGNFINSELLKHGLKLIQGNMKILNKAVNKDFKPFQSYNNHGYVQQTGVFSSISREA